MRRGEQRWARPLAAEGEGAGAGTISVRSPPQPERTLGASPSSRSRWSSTLSSGRGSRCRAGLVAFAPARHDRHGYSERAPADTGERECGSWGRCATSCCSNRGSCSLALIGTPFLQQWTPPWRPRRHGVRSGAGGRSAQPRRSSRAWPTPSSVRWSVQFFLGVAGMRPWLRGGEEGGGQFVFFLGVVTMCRWLRGGEEGVSSFFPWRGDDVSLATRGRRRGAVHFSLAWWRCVVGSEGEKKGEEFICFICCESAVSSVHGWGAAVHQWMLWFY